MFYCIRVSHMHKIITFLSAIISTYTNSFSFPLTVPRLMVVIRKIFCKDLVQEEFINRWVRLDPKILSTLCPFKVARDWKSFLSFRFSSILNIQRGTPKRGISHPPLGVRVQWEFSLFRIESNNFWEKRLNIFFIS